MKLTDEPETEKMLRPKTTQFKKQQPPRSESINTTPVRVQVTRLSADEIEQLKERLKNRSLTPTTTASSRGCGTSGSSIRSSPRSSSSNPTAHRVGEYVFARGSNNHFYPSRIQKIETTTISRSRLYTVEIFEPRVANKLVPMSNTTRHAIALGDLLTDSDIVSVESLKPGHHVLFYLDSKIYEGAFVRFDGQVASAGSFLVDALSNNHSHSQGSGPATQRLM